MTRLLWLILGCALGCANPIQTAAKDASKTATQTAVDTFTSPKDKQQINDLVKGIETSALPTLQKTAVQTVAQARNELLGPTSLADVDALRERLVGQPLRDDVDALLVQEQPRVAALIKTSVEPLDAEVSKWKGLALGAVGAMCALLLSLGVCVYLIRSHHKFLQRLVQPAEPRL